jgi:GNAT superfamily N-acetyltransferase
MLPVFPKIRIARAEEAPLVHGIMQQAFEEYRWTLTPPTGALKETVQDVASAMCKGGAILAFAGDEAIGSARFEEFWPNYLYLGRLSVLPAHRGRGVGKAMVKWLEDYASAFGVGEVRLGVRTGLISNLQFYLRLGYDVDRFDDHSGRRWAVAWMRKSLPVSAGSVLNSATPAYDVTMPRG